MSKYTTEEKYKFLLSKLDVHDVDLWEQDALLAMPSIYFQFGQADNILDIDGIVSKLMSQTGDN